MKKNKRMIKVCRASGMPVDIKDMDRYHEHYQKLYDKVMAKYKIDESKAMDQALSEKLNKLFLRLQKGLGKKYPNIRYWNFIETKLQWRMKVKQHGPIAIAQDSDTGDIAYVILDAGFPG